MRSIDVREKDLIDTFMAQGCDCHRGTPCYTIFTRKYYEDVRAQCQELEKSALDMAIMGYLMGSLQNSNDVQTTSSHRVPKQRKRQRMTYYHQGHKVTLPSD